MSNDPHADPDQDKGLLAYVRGLAERFKKTALGFVLACLMAVLALISNIQGSGVLPLIGALIENLNLPALAIVGALLMFVAGQFIHNLRLKLCCLVAGFFLIVPLVTLVKGQPGRDNLVIVYDDASRVMFPRNVNEQHVDIAEIAKLIEIQEVDSNSLILSLIERPVEGWRSVFQSGFKPRLPILSLREVVDHEGDFFIDISSSDHLTEIVHAMRTEIRDATTTVVYFSNSNIGFASQLEQSIQDGLPNTDVTLTAYTGRRTGLYHPKDAVLVYLGNATDFPDFYRHVATTDFSQLVVPNWIAGEIQIPTGRSLAARGSSAGSKGLLAISSPALSLALADSTHWSNVINAVRYAREEQADVGSYVGDKLSRGKYIEMISFGISDLRR